ncbi:hypothetical protein PsorP6_000319 [Peronosclerospora sorghi]|uniref:Uncharacterized protein n=1 Tax=Peronosclerospora sorghi TaxID=230839 RepID=A0ACC0WXD1_9STRA|nr:hypothetical protein PsorP6_000319 [Peronosclerospora sorghi]
MTSLFAWMLRLQIRKNQYRKEKQQEQVRAHFYKPKQEPYRRAGSAIPIAVKKAGRRVAANPPSLGRAQRPNIDEELSSSCGKAFHPIPQNSVQQLTTFAI